MAIGFDGMVDCTAAAENQLFELLEYIMRKLRASLLLSILVLVVGCSQSVDPKSDETAKWVLTQGGTLWVHGSQLEIVSAKKLPDHPFAFRRIDLNDTEIADDDLTEINSLTSLEYLGLHGTEITDTGVESLTTHHQLQELELSYTQITDAGLVKLSTLPNLGKLFVYHTAITPAGIEKFKELAPNCQLFSD